MATKFPDCTSGLMSHLLTILRAYTEVEDPAWQLYDIAYHEKMAATGRKIWSGMDVQIYQEVCGGRPRRRAISQGEAKGATWATSAKSPMEARRPAVCWQFNEGGCTFGRACKFPHVCENCQGSHPKSQCPSTTGAKEEAETQLGSTVRGNCCRLSLVPRVVGVVVFLESLLVITQ